MENVMENVCHEMLEATCSQAPAGDRCESEEAHSGLSDHGKCLFWPVWLWLLVSFRSEIEGREQTEIGTPGTVGRWGPWHRETERHRQWGLRGEAVTKKEVNDIKKNGVGGSHLSLLTLKQVTTAWSGFYLLVRSVKY